MPSELQERLTQVEQLVREDRDEVSKRSGVPFVLFAYNPDGELEVDTEIRNLIDKLEFNNQTVADIDTRELVFDALEDRGILNRVGDLERRDTQQLLDGLRSSLIDGGEMGELASAIATQAEQADTVIVYRMGILYPFSSASTLMGQLETHTPADTPIVFCYPATIDDKNIRFLDQSEGTYYRANIIVYE